MSSRASGGYVIAEALVVFGLSMMVGAAMCAALFTQSRLTRAIAERIAHNDVVRTVFHILPEEVRLSNPDADFRAIDRDSIAGRWIRATGAVCDITPAAIWIRLRGMRAPDGAKDSLILAGASGERVYALNAITRDQAHCAAGQDEQVWRVAGVAQAVGSAALVFESGTYYLSQRALRYRLGGEGRQPVTEEFIRDADSGIEVMHGADGRPSAMRIELGLRPALQSSAPRYESVTVTLPNSPSNRAN